MKRGLLLITGLLIAYGVQADQTGDCVAGTQYCDCLLYTSDAADE